MTHRNLLVLSVVALAVTGLIAATVPFFYSMGPSDNAGATLPRIKISELEPGQFKYQDLPEFGKAEYRIYILKDYSSDLYVYSVYLLDDMVRLPNYSWWLSDTACVDFGPEHEGNVLKPETWQVAYRDIVPATYLSSLSIDEREQIWKRAISAGESELWVAEIQTEVVGWVAFGPSRDTDASAAVGEIWAIYVTPNHWGTGVGRDLWLVARSRLIERGFSSATLCVLAENKRSISFYGAAGFQPNATPEKEISVGGTKLKELQFQALLGT